MRLVEPVAQEELPPSCLGLIVGSSPSFLVSAESLERLDGGVKRAVLAALATRLAVPAAIIELLAEEVVDEIFQTLSSASVSSGEAHQHRGDAGLRNPPTALPLPEALAASERCRISRRQSEPE
jgi:hypothetical protein